MMNNDVLAIRDDILKTVGSDCERIYLFGSYAYGTPRIGGDNPSDYDIYVVLKDGSKKPILVMEDIYRALNYTSRIPVDVMANYRSGFEARAQQQTMERKIARDGEVLYAGV
jgi:predicted nucleotidyltransferase